MVISLLAGVGLVVLMLWSVVWFDRRQRKRRDERPPQPSKLLRPPGHSLQLEVQKLDDVFSDLAVNLAASGMLFSLSIGLGLQVLAVLLKSPSSFGYLLAMPSGWQALAVPVLAVLSLMWLAYNIASVAQWRTGFISSEPKRFTAEQLKAVLKRLDERCRDVEF